MGRLLLGFPAYRAEASFHIGKGVLVLVPVFGAAFACLVKELEGFFLQRRVAGPDPRAAASGEHGEDPPFAGRFPEALGTNQAKEEPKASRDGPPVFGEPERTLSQAFCRPMADAFLATA